MNNKNAPVKLMHTLDMKHSNLMEEFKNNEDIIIPELINTRIELKKKLSTLKNDDIVEGMTIHDNIKQINLTIKKLKLKKKQYFLDNSKHIFSYFEDKKTISSGTSNKNNSNVLNKFFKIRDVSNNTNQNETKNNTLAKYWKNVNNEITNIHDYIIPNDICHYCSNGEFIPREEEGVMICE